jgi:Zn-dependent protease
MMNSIRKGAFPLFKFAGIDVSLHWSWFLIAAIEISYEKRYTSIGWSIAEYLALFLIVMLHEFGHALACRQTGGTANNIVLWPLGGVAYVDPPQRPGATLWSLAAGPLVNVALLPILYVLVAFANSAHWALTMPNVYTFLQTVELINVGLLIFNMLPIYPLDGGQIFRSLLWFGLGRARSLMVAVVVGFVGVAVMFGWALLAQSGWIAILAAFILMNCWSGLRYAQALLKMAKLPRRPGFACPSCQTAPPLGPYWRCGTCGARFDAFENASAGYGHAAGAICPNCRAHFPVTRCLDCGRWYPMNEWAAAGAITVDSKPVGGAAPVLPSTR